MYTLPPPVGLETLTRAVEVREMWDPVTWTVPPGAARVPDTVTEPLPPDRVMRPLWSWTLVAWITPPALMAFWRMVLAVAAVRRTVGAWSWPCWLIRLLKGWPWALVRWLARVGVTATDTRPSPVKSRVISRPLARIMVPSLAVINPWLTMPGARRAAGPVVVMRPWLRMVAGGWPGTW